MSEISRELQEQQSKDVGEAIKKLFPDAPGIDARNERLRYLQDQIREEQEKALAKCERKA